MQSVTKVRHHFVISALAFAGIVSCMQAERISTDTSGPEGLLLGALDLGVMGVGIGVGSAGGCRSQGVCRIFLSSTTVNGAMTSSTGVSAPAANGPAKADYWCNNDPNKPAGTSLYKAVLAALGIRESPAGSNVDWVLAPNIQYTNPDGSLLFVANASSQWTSAFASPISGATTNAIYVFTGLNGWGTGAANTLCDISGSSWVSNSASNPPVAWAGRPYYYGTAYYPVSGFQIYCNTFNHLLCAEQ